MTFFLQLVVAGISLGMIYALIALGFVIILFGCILILLWTVTDTAERQLMGAFTQLDESEKASHLANKKLNLISSISATK